MAEKDLKNLKDEKKEKGKVGKIIALLLVLIMVVLVAFVLLSKFDVGGLGSKVLAPKLSNVPVVKLILPKTTATLDTSTDETNNPSSSYVFETVDQAIEKLKATEILLKEKEKEAEKLNEDMALLNAEIDRLKIFENNQVQFEADKAAFDQLVGENADPEAFMAYVEKMFPDNALAIYESVVQENQLSEELIDLTNMYQDMKPVNAASILSVTASTDVAMVSQILLKLEPTQAGNILAAMDPVIANKISKYMFPETTN
ncbi:MAG: hypothetical protein H7X94_05970 [Vallitaleaceae bacterium]|nr:hypothetical protein [Vallitaleaceae bacterium]